MARLSSRAERSPEDIAQRFRLLHRGAQRPVINSIPLMRWGLSSSREESHIAEVIWEDVMVEPSISDHDPTAIPCPGALNELDSCLLIILTPRPVMGCPDRERSVGCLHPVCAPESPVLDEAHVLCLLSPQRAQDRQNQRSLQVDPRRTLAIISDEGFLHAAGEIEDQADPPLGRVHPVYGATRESTGDP